MVFLMPEHLLFLSANIILCFLSDLDILYFYVHFLSFHSLIKNYLSKAYKYSNIHKILSSLSYYNDIHYDRSRLFKTKSYEFFQGWPNFCPFLLSFSFSLFMTLLLLSEKFFLFELTHWTIEDNGRENTNC